MPRKVESLDDCASGADYTELMQRLGVDLGPPNGSYKQIERNGYTARWPNSDRTLPKETRASINGILVKMGLVLAVVATIAAAWWMW